MNFDKARGRQDGSGNQHGLWRNSFSSASIYAMKIRLISIGSRLLLFLLSRLDPHTVHAKILS